MKFQASRSRKTATTSFLGAALIAMASLSFSVTPASAVETHPFTGVTIGPGGKNAVGQFTNLQSVAIDPSSGDLYVLDGTSQGRLYKFDGAGEAIDFSATGTNFVEGTGGTLGNTESQVAIAPPGAAGGTAGDIYVANREALLIYSPAGVEIGQIASGNERLCGVAVDATGNVFTKKDLDNGDPAVQEFSPTANPITGADESGKSIPIEDTCNLAVDGKGRIYASGEGIGQNLWKLESLGASAKQLFDPDSSTVASEPVTDDVYVSHGTEIVQYAEDGSVVSRFGQGRLSEAPGVAVAGSQGDVFVSARFSEGNSPPIYKGRVDVFGPLADLPLTVTTAPTAISKTTATLHGTINPEGGPAATCEFEYTTESAFEAEGFEGATAAACEPGGPFVDGAPEAVSAPITGLSPGTEYRYRLVGENEKGRLGSDENGSESNGTPRFEALAPFGARTGSVSAVTGTSAVLDGSIDPEGAPISECFFEYGTSTAYGSKAPCTDPDADEIGNGNAPVVVHTEVSGLTAGTEYHFRLLAASPEFPGLFARGVDENFGTKAPPEIVSQSLSNVGLTSATISGSINPHSSATTYFVEYVTLQQFEEEGYASAIEVPLGGGEIGKGFAAVAVTQELTGLLPGTTYHFRLFAANGEGHDEGPDESFRTYTNAPVFGSCPANEAFRTEASALLPDCRAYEQASPADKNGGSAGGLYPQMFAAEDGSAVTFYTSSFSLPPGERGGSQDYATYLASRGETGWSAQRLLPPQQFGVSADYLGSSTDLRYAVVEAGDPVESGLYLIDTDSGAVSRVAPDYPRERARTPQFGLDGLTADGSRIFFESTAAVEVSPGSPEPVAGKDNLYVWERSTGQVSLAGVLPAADGGGAPTEGSFGGAYEWYEKEDTKIGGALNRSSASPEPLAVEALHAVSSNGSQIFFTAAGTGQLYLRKGLGGASTGTVRISTPNRGVSSTQRPSAFQEATPDGSRAFFLSRQKLTAEATTGPLEEGNDLYRWDASAASGKSLTDVTPDAADPNGAEVQGLLGVAPDGSSGYFIARGGLSEGAITGEENLYRFSEEASGHFHVALIAVLKEPNSTERESVDRRNISPKVFYNSVIYRTSRISDGGETLLFSSTRPLTEYDNSNSQGIECESGGCPELYLYSARNKDIACVSCDPTGRPPLGAATLQGVDFDAFFNPTAPPAVSFGRNLSSGGTKVFFQSPDPLVAADTNADEGCPASGARNGLTGGCQDVYEWEAAGSGSCRYEEANGGCIYLLSTGKSEEPSYFVGASTDGSSAFLATTSQLVPADIDHADDIYDVREGGGLASQHAAPPAPCESGHSCRGQVATSPPTGSPGTASFQGIGNEMLKACKKGSVRKGATCVKKQAQRKHQKKKRKKRAHNKKRSTRRQKLRGAK